MELETLFVDVGSNRDMQHHVHSRDMIFIP
jgi:hypothetical protein